MNKVRARIQIFARVHCEKTEDNATMTKYEWYIFCKTQRITKIDATIDEKVGERKTTTTRKLLNKSANPLTLGFLVSDLSC